MSNKNPIGVCDAGLGGLTVVAELQKLLPGENIVYYGDSKRNPYGNHGTEKIVDMSCEMFDFLVERNAKMIIIACNTISTLMDHFKDRYDIPIIGIVEPASEYVAKLNLSQVGVIATNATINSGAYESLIKKHNSKTEVYGQGSKWLANLIDGGKATEQELDAEIKENMDILLEKAPVKHVILGCTHYPIVEKNFRRLYPDIEFINPALTEALKAKELLEKNDSLHPSNEGTFEIYTSGTNLEVYRTICEKLECKKIDRIATHEVGTL